MELICERVAKGEIVIANNPSRPLQKVVGIGTGLRTKVNASIGTSSDICDLEAEIRKARIAEEEGAETLMELSAGGDLDCTREAITVARSQRHLHHVQRLLRHEKRGGGLPKRHHWRQALDLRVRLFCLSAIQIRQHFLQQHRIYPPTAGAF